MCCLFSNNCCNGCRRQSPPPRPITVATAGPRGPQGPQGATGATGAQGPSGTNDAVYAGVNAATTVDAGAIIPIARLAATAGTTMTVSNNAVNLPAAGTYLISYFINGSVADGNLSASLYLNGAQVDGETIIMTNTADFSSAASKTILLTTTAAGTLSLYNSSAGTATISSATLTVLKTA